jgi:hypothetical protein
MIRVAPRRSPPSSTSSAHTRLHRLHRVHRNAATASLMTCASPSSIPSSSAPVVVAHRRIMSRDLGCAVVWLHPWPCEQTSPWEAWIPVQLLNHAGELASPGAMAAARAGCTSLSSTYPGRLAKHYGSPPRIQRLHRDGGGGTCPAMKEIVEGREQAKGCRSTWRWWLMDAGRGIWPGWAWIVDSGRNRWGRIDWPDMEWGGRWGRGRKRRWGSVQDRSLDFFSDQTLLVFFYRRRFSMTYETIFLTYHGFLIITTSRNLYLLIEIGDVWQKYNTHA